ncbi:MAG: hypothetical protein EZS28_049184, partial [Streblomastix strix]
ENVRPNVYISESGEQILVDLINEKIKDHRAPGQSEVADLMRMQRCNELETTLEMACAMGLGKLQDEFSRIVDYPSKQKVSELIQEHKMSFSRPSDLEFQRSQAGMASNIRHWFSDPFTEDITNGVTEFFFINSDEINVDADMGCRVAKPKSFSRAPAETDAGTPHHITLMMTITPNGQNPPPFIIIGGLAKVPEALQHYMDDGLAYFVCNSSGWIDVPTYRIFAQFLVDWINKRRQQKGLDIRQKALLVLDGHSTRLDEAATDIFINNNCSVITFPGAVTHIMQPIDRVLAPDFGRFYRAELRRLTIMTRDQLSTTNNVAELKRNNIILATIDATRQVTT